MERIREARRGTVNGSLSRRRPRSSSLRDSPEDDGGLDMQEATRLRDRGGKRHRDRDRSSRSKRRGERLIHGGGGGGNRDDGDDTSDESLDDADDGEEEAVLPPPMRLPSPHSAAIPVSSSSVPPGNHLRRSFPAKLVRAPAVWNVSDEMIGVPVPRKARSASGKRSQDAWVSGAVAGAGDAGHQQSSASPARPSSLCPSVKKKIKTIGENKPPKLAKSTSIQDIEIEVAEVLFGMTRQFQPKEESQTSPPISGQTIFQITAPKRKKPRPVKLDDEHGPVAAAVIPCDPALSSAPEAVPDSLPNAAAVALPSRTENSAASAVENGGATLVGSAAEDVQRMRELVTESKASKEEFAGEEIATAAKDEVAFPAKVTSCPLIDNPLEKKQDPAATGGCREDKFSIDLMASPPGKSSPERDGFQDNSPAVPADQKPVVDADGNYKKFDVSSKVDEVKTGPMRIEQPGEGRRAIGTEYDLNEQMGNERALDLQSDPERIGKDGIGDGGGQQVQKLHSRAARTETKPEKAGGAPTASVPPPTTIAGWAGGLPLGFIGHPALLQSVLPTDGISGSSKTMQNPSFLPLPQRSLKRCAMHCHIAKNIHYHQQMPKMNPFWPAAAAAAGAMRPVYGAVGAMPPVYGAPPYNLNAVPPMESPVVFGSSLQDKASAPSKMAAAAPSAGSALAEAAQSKQFVLQQLPNPGAVNTMIHGPALVFSLNQQAAAAAAAAAAGGRPGGPKPSNGDGSGSSSWAPNSGLASSTNYGQVAAPMNFHYAPQNEAQAQYLAILQNTAYQLPIPAPAGGSPAYRGASMAQAMPFFNGSFYPQQMLPPTMSQQLPLPPVTATQHGQPNPSTSSRSSSSQKLPQKLQQGAVGGGVSSPTTAASAHAVGSSHSFPSSKQRPRLLPHQARPSETEVSEDSPSSTAADSRLPLSQKDIYAMPVLPRSFALVSPTGAASHLEKKAAPPSQQQGGVKMELAPTQSFSMSLASLGNAAAVAGGAPPPGLDLQAVAQNHNAFLGLPETARQGYQINPTAAAAPHLKKSQSQSQFPEGPRPSRDPLRGASAGGGVPGEERKFMDIGKAAVNAQHHQSLNFSRPSDSSSSIPSLLATGGVAAEGATRTLSLISPLSNSNERSRASSPSPTTSVAATTTIAVSNPLHHHQQQQLVSRTKSSSGTSAASLYSERLPAVSAVAKFPSPLSGFPPSHQGAIQGNSTAHPQLWNKSPARAAMAAPPPSDPASSSMKTHNHPPQQQVQSQSQSHSRVPQQSLLSPASWSQIHQTQISFGANTHRVAALPGQQQRHHGVGSAMPVLASAPSGASIVMGPPPPSLTSKGTGGGAGAGGSPRATTASSKSAPPPASPIVRLSAQTAAKSPPLSSGGKPSPASNQHSLSMLGHPRVSSSSGSSTSKQPPPPHAQPQQKQASFPHPQLFFNNAYMQSQASQLNASSASYYKSYPSEQPQLQQSHLPGLVPSSTGILSLAPSSQSAASAANGTKELPAGGILQHPGVAVGGLPYIQTTPSAPVKAAEQKPAPGTDNQNASKLPEKR